MSSTIMVVDYGMGNLHSVAKAIEHAGARVHVTDSASDLKKAKAIVLPGVGAFGEAARRLRTKKLFGVIREALGGGKPFLGICLGLQLLFERSEESPEEKGFGFFKGPVVRFRMKAKSSLKVPHMGWNTVEKGPAGSTPFLTGVSQKDYVYFVHSYFPAPLEKQFVAGISRYGAPFCSAMSCGSLFASQFHPEKSGDVGQRILRNFVRLASKGGGHARHTGY